MARTGRPPKPTALKELEGNPGKRPLNKDEPKPKQQAPKCPSWLLPDAKAEWKRLSKELEALGLLTEVDMAAFAGYCQAYARWKEAEEFISKHGSILKTSTGYIQQIPQVSIAQQNLKQMRNFCSELGLSPSARSRLSISNRGSTIEGDAMEALLAGVPDGDDLVVH